MKNRRLEISLEGYAEEDINEWSKLGVEFFLYAQCYEAALDAILSNINYDRSVRRNSDRDKYVFVGSENDYSAPLDKSNIIAFIGGRGTGKTTAVNEFSKILCNYHDNYQKWSSRLVHNDKESDGRESEYKYEYCFHVLKPIDASVLESKEDLMEVILANMYQSFREKAKKIANKPEVIQHIIRNFDDAFQNYVNVGKMNDKRHIYDDTILARLEDTSNSLKTKNTIGKLTDDFLRLLNDEKNIDNSYLVIVIDDLDMSLENGFEMLEQLHKYLSNHRIIILIAIDYKQMKMLCNQHFANCLMPKHGGSNEEIFENFYDKTKKLSSDYLLKLIPLSNRIYMPEEPLNKNGVITDSKEYRIKEYVLRKIAAKMNIYYDAIGLKRHFCLPDTVRELVSYNDFLDSLYSMEEIEQLEERKAERCMVLYDQNHERFNADLRNRMAISVLDDDQWDIYQLIVARNIERRARYAVNFLRSWIKTRTKDMEDTVDGQNYCYSDLLQVIYELGRADYKDKALVHCIIASFTTEMVREYYSYRHNIDNEARNRAAKRLKCFLGDTFGGKWFDECMPKIQVSGSQIVERKVGYIAKAVISRWELELGRSEPMTGDIGSWLTEELSDLLPCIEYIACLFYDFRDENGKVIEPRWEFEVVSGNTEDGDKVSLRISSGARTASFDFLGFIGKEIKEKKDETEKGEGQNSVNGTDDKISKSLRECLYGLLSSLEYSSLKKEKLLNKLERKLRQKSIWQNNEESENATFPFYDFDMSYNVMKRVIVRLEDSMFLKSMNVYDYLYTAYGYIAEELYKEEKFYKEEKLYKELDDEKKTPKFLKNFIHSPCMKIFNIAFVGDTGQKICNQQDGVLTEKRRKFFDATIGQLEEEISDLESLNING